MKNHQNSQKFNTNKFTNGDDKHLGHLNRYINSFYELFLIRGYVPRYTVKTNSLKKAEESPQTNFIPNFFFLKYTIPGTTLEIDRTLDIIEDFQARSIKE